MEDRQVTDDDKIREHYTVTRNTRLKMHLLNMGQMEIWKEGTKHNLAELQADLVGGEGVLHSRETCPYYIENERKPNPDAS